MCDHTGGYQIWHIVIMLEGTNYGTVILLHGTMAQYVIMLEDTNYGTMCDCAIGHYVTMCDHTGVLLVCDLKR